MGVFPSGQRGQTVNLLFDDYDGSNLSAPTKKRKSSPKGLLFRYNKWVDGSCAAR